MTTYGRPGVYVTEQLVNPTPNGSPSSPSVAGFIGEHWCGPVGVPILCNSWADFVRYFGGFNTTAVPALTNPYLVYSVYEYFLNGGIQAWVARIGSSITPGVGASVTLQDSSATPQATLQLTTGRLGITGDPGTWGNSLSVVIVNRGGAGSGRFDLTLYRGGVSPQNVLEAWTDLSMNHNDPRYVVSIINSAIAGSIWVVATDEGDVASPPNNAPAAVTASFTGGVDSASPTTTDRINAVTNGTSPFDQVPGILNFNMPGESASTVIDAAITYAQTRPYSFLVIDPPQSSTPAAAVSYIQSLSPVSSYAAVYYPWVWASDPSSSTLGNSKLLPPGGFVLGQMVSVDTIIGPWRAPAGTNTALAALQAERRLTPSDLDTLNSNNVNALRTLSSGAVLIWGARTMETGFASLYVPIRRTLNYIENSSVQLMLPFVFRENDAILWGDITAALDRFLGGMYAGNAFQGNTAAEAYYVTCNSSNNTPQTEQQGITVAHVGVALVYPAEFIVITVTQILASGATVALATV